MRALSTVLGFAPEEIVFMNSVMRTAAETIFLLKSFLLDALQLNSHSPHEL